MFSDLGYKIDIEVLNAGNYGVPQERKRVILVGTAKGIQFSYPEKVNKLENSAYKVEITDDTTNQITEKKTIEVEKAVDISALMALGDINHGEKVFKKCSACHSIEAGGGNKIGPALYNVVGRKIAAVTDYKYSKALVDYKKNWSFEELNGFLIKPQKWIKGTKMAYAGLRKEKDRASVILYLNKYSDSPIPLP